MKINILTNTKAKKRRIDKINDDNYVAWIKAEPKNNAANAEIISLLSDYFNVDSSKIKIIKGQKSRKKVININN